MADSREENGRHLARAGHVTPRSEISWTVHGNKDYVVLIDPETCTCVDWAVQNNKGLGRRCKHIWAVHFYLEAMAKSSILVPKVESIGSRRRLAWEV